MIEILGRFPVFYVVTFGAFVTELALVWIRMAWRAIRRLPEKGFVQILHLDQLAIGLKHVGGRVALFAGQVGVLAFQSVAGQFMVEFLQGGFPADELEGFAIMFQMAAHAVLAIWIAHFEFKVITVPGRKILRNFLVATDALESRRAGSERMTGSALRGAAQRRMGVRKGAWRNLCMNGRRNKRSDAKHRNEMKRNRPRSV